MRAYSGAVSNTETAQPTSTRPTTLQEDYVIQDTSNQPEGGKDVAEMFRCAMRRQELERVFWERRYPGDDLR